MKMKPAIQLTTILLMITTITLIACNRDKGNDPVQSKTELLTSAPWKRTALTSTPAYDWYGNSVFATDI